MPDSSPKRKPKKKAPGHFKTGDSNLVAGLLAGAEDVAGRSFLGGGATAPNPGPAHGPTPGTQPAVETPPSISQPAVATVDAAPVDTPAAAGPAEAGVEPVGDSDDSQPVAAPEEAEQAPAVTIPATRPGRSRTQQPASPPRRRPRSGGKPWAHAAVLESFADAKIHSENWRSHGFRIDPEVLVLLKKRMQADRRSSGNPGLAIGHYLDAALRHAPEDIEAQIAMAQSFLTARMAIVDSGKQSTYRVGPAAYEMVSSLNQALQEADYGRRGLYVVSAAAEDFLAAMDTEGGLKPPQRRRM